METDALLQRLSAEAIPLGEKLTDAVAYLGFLAKREAGTAVEDLGTLGAFARMLTGLDIKTDEAGLFKALAAYLKSSPAFQSADYMEDYCGLDFASVDPCFQVDYTGSYTFVPASMLPESLAGERPCLLTLARFYFEHLPTPMGTRADLVGVSLPGLELDSAVIHGSRMGEAVLVGSVFSGCHLDSVRLNSANLERCTFTGCRFKQVDLTACQLEGAVFVDCAFEGGAIGDNCFEGVTFTDCRFAGTAMNAIDFGSTDLSRCRFDSCWVSGALLGRVSGLSQGMLEVLYGDDSTHLPGHLKHPSFWPHQGDIPTWRHWMDSGETVESTATLRYE